VIVVIVALENELSRRRLPGDVEIVHSGVGKVNAAIATSQVILTRRPALIVNYGTAGRINSRLHGLLDVARVVQRDMMAMPLAERGTTPFAAEAAQIHSGFDGVLCATGDSFVTRVDPWLGERQVDVVDMELYAIAHACRRYGVPWRSFKFVTDDANEQAADDWSGKVNDGENFFIARLEQIHAGG
jgi:adenosylhomocysteine nucleosidase